MLRWFIAWRETFWSVQIILVFILKIEAVKQNRRKFKKQNNKTQLLKINGLG